MEFIADFGAALTIPMAIVLLVILVIAFISSFFSNFVNSCFMLLFTGLFLIVILIREDELIAYLFHGTTSKEQDLYRKILVIAVSFLIAFLQFAPLFWSWIDNDTYLVLGTLVEKTSYMGLIFGASYGGIAAVVAFGFVVTNTESLFRVMAIIEIIVSGIRFLYALYQLIDKIKSKKSRKSRKRKLRRK